MENFNQKYTKWKADMVNLINTGGIPLAVVDDFLTTLKAEVARAIAMEAKQEAEREAKIAKEDEISRQIKQDAEELLTEGEEQWQK